ncbi:hypothetical protein K402DRAFT_195539 [Aulographum hederae CBS 113979]|uniref:BTB domain-containing protein n=1 Tax=Aulographum hederae CBS 113979 TaxID=1176131 RepID=A0A6G1GNS1_9PEZI|nr:hypothetical protein K402DRAFT_195539 [Aulographum hederae CBS 113979]
MSEGTFHGDDDFMRIKDETPPGLHSLTYGLNSALESGQFSDLTIRGGGEEWKAHKVVMCPQSEYFAKACASLETSSSNVIDLGDNLDLYAFHGLILFIPLLFLTSFEKK